MDTMAKEKVEIGDLVALERSLRELPILLYNMEVCKTNLELINKVFEILNREDCDKILEEMSRESLKILTGSVMSVVMRLGNREGLLITRDSISLREEIGGARISDNLRNICNLITDNPFQFLLAKVSQNGQSFKSKLVKEDTFCSLKNRIREFYQDLSDLIKIGQTQSEEVTVSEELEEPETSEGTKEEEKTEEAGEDTEGKENTPIDEEKTPANLSKKCQHLGDELFNYYQHEHKRNEIPFLFFKSMIKRNNQPIDESIWTEMVAEMESTRKQGKGSVGLTFSGKRGIVNMTILSKFAKEGGDVPYKVNLQAHFGDICELKSGKLSLTPTWEKSIASMLKDL
jgi:hypothetical protein